MTPVDTATTSRASTRSLTSIQAVVAAQRWALEQYPEVVVYGEDVGKPGGPFGSARGLQDRFGPGRVFDTPISRRPRCSARPSARRCAGSDRSSRSCSSTSRSSRSMRS